jgi:hypothetical protein
MTATEMTIPETASWLKARDNFLVLTHLRPDGAIRSEAAARSSAGCAIWVKTAYILRNPEATAPLCGVRRKVLAPGNISPSFV